MKFIFNTDYSHLGLVDALICSYVESVHNGSIYRKKLIGYCMINFQLSTRTIERSISRLIECQMFRQIDGQLVLIRKEPKELIKKHELIDIQKKESIEVISDEEMKELLKSLA